MTILFSCLYSKIVKETKKNDFDSTCLGFKLSR